MANRAKRGMRAAINAAHASNSPNFKVGAAIMRGSKVISVGWNYFRKTHPRSCTHLSTVHAEVNVLNGLRREELEGCDIFVARVTPGGIVSIAKPCEGCQEMLGALPIRRVYYTNRQGKIRRYNNG